MNFNNIYKKINSVIFFQSAKKTYRSEILKNHNILVKKSICSFPNQLIQPKYFLDKGYVLGKILKLIGIKATQFNPWTEYDVIISWQDLTFDSVDVKKYIINSYNHTKKNIPTCMINFGLCDISKETIGKTNKFVFGYDLDINPETYAEKCVEKSKFNATHDGRIIQCPIANNKILDDKVYSILINNEKDGFVYDHRIIYMRKTLDLFYLKKRPVGSRFSNTNSSASIELTKDFFTTIEIDKINNFCNEMKVDYAEIDVLRDNSSGAIYIVDISRTPAGPPNGLPNRAKAFAVGKLAAEFSKAFLFE
jgi:hypothetical protein